MKDGARPKNVPRGGSWNDEAGAAGTGSGASDLVSILFGVGVGTLVAGTLVIAGLKAGITPGVSPLVILIAWGLFARMSHGGRGTRFLNIAQVAGSAGMAVTSGVIFTAPVVQILYAELGREVPPVGTLTLIFLSIAGSLIGFGFVGLATRKFLTDPTLPAPEARACETMIESAAADREARPRMGRSLFAGLGLSFLAPLLQNLGLAAGEVHLASRTSEDGSRQAGIGLPYSPIYLGIGGLLTLATALLVFGGSFLRLIGDWMLAGVSAGTDAAARFPDNSMRWVGGGAMTVAVVYSLWRFMGLGKRQAGAAASGQDERVLLIDPGKRRGQQLAILLGTAMVVGWLVATKGVSAFTVSMSAAVLAMSGLMVTLGAILSLQIGSSASPVSGTIFVTTLVLCLVALATGHRQPEDVLILTPLIVAACVAVCTANDSSQDYKTLQLCGVRVQDGFLAQFLGLMAGCIVVPIALFYAHDAYVLGSPELPAPQGTMFATLIQALLLQGALPWGPILIGLAVGAFAVGMDVLGQRRGIQLPSMALAVGIYLPADIGIGILIGAGFRWIAERGRGQSHESILAAAGLITGAALLELILGAGISTFELDLDALRRFGTPDPTDAGTAHWTELPHAVPIVLAGLGILSLGGLLYLNSRNAGREGG